MATELDIKSTEPWYLVTATLGEVNFILTFAWNTRDSRWYMSIAQADGTELVSGIAIVTDYPLFNRFASADLPDGMLIFMDSTQKGYEPGRYDLGARTRLCWFTSAELEDVL